ncbi:hypothetical protein RAJCM14343_1783 [Rhodococcus aetherivorans]|uniref:Uncharacterized protein n=1 Tax=Rhodococcus aetherivorans TaxID=191292 RepID=A0ABQ0YJ00_9NOCA|nr:hypothetical protein RAJCM14343_1783 [Rhodococcus aetherivorans]CCW09540.1 hypothetical protein EBESD8_670 [Rhodococcus aetherivorans]
MTSGPGHHAHGTAPASTGRDACGRIVDDVPAANPSGTGTAQS